jgi:tripartite-type tricarboxylate transporter receptor subunit TctC
LSETTSNNSPAEQTHISEWDDVVKRNLEQQELNEKIETEQEQKPQVNYVDDEEFQKLLEQDNTELHSAGNYDMVVEYID